MKIAISGFKGESPILDPRLLPESQAQVARNVYLRRGTLKPHRGMKPAASLPSTINPANLYHYDEGNSGEGFWFSWGDEYDIDVVRSPLADDEYGRVYWTGQGIPKMASILDATTGTGPYPSQWSDLGVPAPSDPPVAEAPSERDEVPDVAVETVYVVTLVTRFGEEGPPTDPSEFVMRWDDVSDSPAGGNVELSLPSPPSTNQTFTKKRIYRVESGNTYQRVAEVDQSQTTFNDNVASDRLGAVLESLDWDGPNPAMVGLTGMPNGVMAGFFENTLCFSEPYLPHAWPVSYRLTFPEPIVGLASVSSGLIVATRGQPWIVTGSTPEAMAQMPLEINQPCIAKSSIVDMGGYALYASHDGLVAIGENQANVATMNVFSREQWQAMAPKTIHAYRYDGQYLAFYDGGCMAFHPERGVQFFDASAAGGYYDISDDNLYLIQGQSIAAWDRGDLMTLTWRSKIHEVPPGAAGFSCAKVIAYSYPVTLRLIADGETVIEHAVSSSAMFRLPAGHTLSRDWEIELTGEAEVSSVQIATSPGELI